MKLIKLVLNERRLAYEQAKAIWEQGQQNAAAEPEAEPAKEEKSDAAASTSA